MTEFKQIMTDLKNRRFKPIYFLMGEETYYIDAITNYIVDNVLTEEEKGFNQTVYYGKDVDAATVVMASRRYPMMSKYQVVVVKEAQDIENIDELQHYASAPLNSTILVVNYKYKTLDRRKKLGSILKKNNAIFEFKKLYDNQVGAWLTQYLKDQGLTIDVKAGALMTDYLGTNLSKMVKEIDKLKVAVGPGLKHITPDHIEKNIGMSKDYNSFELQKALITKDVLKANRIIKVFGKDPKSHPIQAVISVLFNYFSKLMVYYYLPDKAKGNVARELGIREFFVQDYSMGARNYPARKVVSIISVLREYDMKSKGFGNVSANNGELLKEMVFKILH
ncbi:DNA polymerase III, delta subunit [Saccharicrinis carchari]|uniref:DNA polymerase III, delta subunit n=1 Tax=Saccharicrinis carchari TaxID=1168039 RepID=A0A521CK10_SACCC|nr:DNA polymerase III subunit delta [Saccharicrinis carchari]SMO59742.1 DNA polymerase III, delta subunit [Saccharicrinis carchari]